jgi:ABC-type branched-subunit amino acid transport system permease subunit
LAPSSVPDYKDFRDVLSGITQRYLLIIGILFLLVIVFAPKGVVGILEGFSQGSQDRKNGEKD